jgi:hypothetical protein
VYRSLLNIVASEDKYMAVLKKVKRKGNARNRYQNGIVAYLRRRTWNASAEKIKR